MRYNVRKFNADAILFGENQCKKIGILRGKKCYFKGCPIFPKEIHLAIINNVLFYVPLPPPLPKKNCSAKVNMWIYLCLLSISCYVYLYRPDNEIML